MPDPKPDLNSLFGIGKSMDDTVLRAEIEKLQLAFIATADRYEIMQKAGDELRAHLELSDGKRLMADLLVLFEKYPRMQDPELMPIFREAAVKIEDGDLRYRAEMGAEAIRAARSRGLNARKEIKDMTKILREVIAFGQEHPEMLEPGEMTSLKKLLIVYLAQK